MVDDEIGAEFRARSVLRSSPAVAITRA